jgi:choline-sulfatase
MIWLLRLEVNPPAGVLGWSAMHSLHRSQTCRAVRSLVIAVGALTVGMSGCSRTPPANVLLITIDTLRADHLGCYGFRLAHTPAIDALAEEGVRCSNAIAAAPITLPSHTSIMTGLLPPAHGVRDNGAYALSDDAVTLAERLRDAGYATQAFISALVLNRRYNLDQGFEGYDDDLWAEDEPKLFMIRERRGTATADRAVSWLDAWHSGPDRKPFFVWVHLFDPHQPYNPPVADRIISPSAYDGEIAAADRAVSTIIDAVRRLGVLDNTVVVLTADHGESLGEHQEATHALFIYDATVHVPLIWRYPGSLPGGRTYDGPVRNIDIAPTLLALLGLPGGDRMQGADLLRPLRGLAAEPQLPQYSESLLSEVGFGMAPLYGIRSNGKKWIRAPKPELYDLRTDPFELDNEYVEGDPTAAGLDRLLQTILDDCEQHSLNATASPMSKETLEALMSLGYLAPAEERTAMHGMDPKDGIQIYNQLEDARHLAQQDNWEDAERILHTILREVPEHNTARNILALVLLRQGRNDEARQEYLRSLASDPNQSRVHLMLGTIALFADDLDTADQHFMAALEITPGFVEAMSNLGVTAALRGDEAAAERWYREAIAADPGFPRVYRRLADLQFERNDFASALASYRRVLEALPDDFQSLVQAGTCARRTGDVEASASFFDAAARLRPDSWIPVYNHACLMAVTGDRVAALQLLRRALELRPAAVDLLADDTDWESLRNDPEFARVASSNDPLG